MDFKEVLEGLYNATGKVVLLGVSLCGVLYVIDYFYRQRDLGKAVQARKHAPSLPPAPAAALAAAGTSASAAAKGVVTASQSGPPVELDEAAHKAQIDDLLKKAQAQANKLGDPKLSMEHMVLALSENQRFSEILSCAEGLSEEELKKAIKKSRVMFNHPQHPDIIEVQPTALSKYGRDLVVLARERKLDPLVGRNDELRRVINILTRRTKNNPVILGDSGVGKTALVEGLAQRIAAGDVPASLKNATIIALDMGLLMAGAAFPGEFEQRLSSVFKEMVEHPSGACILFIDDIHTVTGPNAQQGGGVMDASMLLKPLLARGELRCIGATTLDKYRKFIEKDPALERRFQQYSISQPSVSETVSILRGLKPSYEKHHKVRITDAALVTAAELSNRYIPDRFLPDKAIDLVDEATARVKLEIDLKPEQLDRLERNIRIMEAERRLLRKSAGGFRNDAQKLAELEIELEELKSQRTSIMHRYESELGQVDELSSLQAVVDQLQDEIDALEAEEEAAAANPPAAQAEAEAPTNLQESERRRRELEKSRAKEQKDREAKLADLDNRLMAAQALSRSKRAASASLAPRNEVTEADVARVISSWTGIPLTKLVESERDKLLHLGDELHTRIIGQEEAVAAVAEAIQRSRAGMKDPNGPIASFLFLGPTGVGKTELAKVLASYLFNSEEAMVRLDMSEYMEKHAVSKLIGAPPGYVGFDEGGQLTEAVRRKPFSVVLFDEVEKAHVDVFNLLLQLLDDGRVTDSQGRTVNFKNAIIILTSNLGSADIYRAAAAKKAGTDPHKVLADTKDLVMDQVRKHFPPEFVNRVDEFIIFDPLRPDQIRSIVTLRTRGVVKRLADKKIGMRLDESAMQYLAVKGYDPVFGARPVKRAVQRELETPLAQALLRGDFQEDDTVVVSATEGAEHLTFRRQRAGEPDLPEPAPAARAQPVQQLHAPSNNGTAATGGSSRSDAGDAAGSSSTVKVQDFQAAPRAPKFDPLKKMTKLSQQGVDITKDGAAMNRDGYTLPTAEG